MSLGSAEGVADICGSSDTALIGRQLTIARAHLDTLLDKSGLTAPDTDTLLSHAVDLLASSFIAIKPGAVDPRTNYAVDGFKRSEALGSQPGEYAELANTIIADYIAANISESPLPGMAIVGRQGRRIGEYTEMTEDEEEVY